MRLFSAIRRLVLRVQQNSVLRGAAFVAAATLAAKGISLLKDVVVAGKYGLSAELDVFLFGLALLELLLSFLIGALQYSFIPVVSRAERSGSRAAVQSLFSSVLTLSSLTLGMLAVAVWIGAPFVENLPGAQSLVAAESLQTVLRVALPVLFLFSFSTLCQGLLQAQRVFFLPTLSRAITPLILGVAVLLFGGVFPALSVLTAGLVTGALLEAVALGCLLVRTGLRPVPGKIVITPELKVLGHQTALLLFGTACSMMIVYVERSFAAQAGEGGVSALTYSSKISSMLIGLITMSLSASLLPHLSRSWAAGEYQETKRRVWRYTVILLGVMLPFAAFSALLSEPITALFFQRGAFTSSDTELVSGVQQIYLLSIPFVVAGVPVNRLMLAMGKNHLLTLVSVLGLFVAVVLNTVLFPHFGLKGIALANIAVQIFSTGASFALMRRTAQAVRSTGQNVPSTHGRG